MKDQPFVMPSHNTRKRLISDDITRRLHAMELSRVTELYITEWGEPPNFPPAFLSTIGIERTLL